MAVSYKYLLALFHDVVGQRSSWRCEFPGCSAMGRHLIAHHHFRKKNTSVKFDPANGIYLCDYCHCQGPNSAHGSPESFLKIILDAGVRTEEWLADLTVKRNMIVDGGDAFRVDWKIRLQEELRREA